MDKKIVAACSGVIFTASLLAAPAQAEKDYTAVLNEDGKYCAKVEVVGVAGMTTRKVKCRTLDQWEEAGYVVSRKEAE